MALLKRKTTQSHNPLVCPVCSEPKQTFWSSWPATADDTPINEADFATQFCRNPWEEDLQRDDLDVLPKHALDEGVEDQPLHESINKK